MPETTFALATHRLRHFIFSTGTDKTATARDIPLVSEPGTA